MYFTTLFESTSNMKIIIIHFDIDSIKNAQVNYYANYVATKYQYNIIKFNIIKFNITI